MHRKLSLSLLPSFFALISLSLLPVSASAIQSSILPTTIGVYDKGGDFSLGPLVVAPIDTQYMSFAVWNLLDSLGTDSVQREFPAYGPGDTLFIRPDGKQVRLPDISRFYLVHFTDSVDFVSFQSLYSAIAPTSSVSPN